MEDKIIRYIIDELQGGNEELEISPSDDLLGGGLLESMSMMRLIQYIEEEFVLKVTPQDMTIENFMTVGDMVKYINSKK